MGMIAWWAEKIAGSINSLISGRNAVIATLLITLMLPACSSAGTELAAIRLPKGFSIELYAGNLPGARSMALGAQGTLFVGTRGEGKVYAVVGRTAAGQPRKRYVIAEGLDSPNGVAFRNGSLYVAEIGRVIRFDGIEDRLDHPPAPVVVNDSFPKKSHHGWKFIRFGPDNKLYVPVGAPCNVCEERDPRFASIMRMDPDGKNLELFASGVRNSVGFDWQPRTGELWFTDNGRDWLGDNLPPDELNRATKAGLHFGFPYRHGANIPDPKYGKGHGTGKFVPPERGLDPHVAALGMRFYTGSMFPEEYRDQIFIAEHGSWNRSRPAGYRITLVRLKGNRPVSYEVFAEGWLRGNKAWGRPVDLQVMPDGSLLVSDDRAGAIYRISWKGNLK